MKVKPGKCYISLRTNLIDLRLDEECIKSSSSEKLLEITIDSDLKFDKHIPDLCGNASKKLNAIYWIVG